MQPQSITRAFAERTLATLRALEANAEPDVQRAAARDLRIGDDWPEDLKPEADAIMRRLRAGGVAPPTWGHAANVLALITRPR
ncbi:hypothetical protein D3C72_1836260 [compost metagenome]